MEAGHRRWSSGWSNGRAETSDHPLHRLQRPPELEFEKREGVIGDFDEGHGRDLVERLIKSQSATPVEGGAWSGNQLAAQAATSRLRHAVIRMSLCTH